MIGSSFQGLLNYAIQRKGYTVGESVLEDLDKIESRKQDLRRQAYPDRVLGLILDLMVSWGFYRERLTSKFWEDMKQHGVEGAEEHRVTIDFLKSSTCERLLREFKPFSGRPANDLVTRLDRLLEQLQAISLKEWLDKRYAERSTRDPELRKINFGEKSIDELLRDCGYLDRAPIDIHEQRFQVRTGIFQGYSEHGNPFDKRDYHTALTNFCNIELGGLELAGHALSQAPGIVDLVIWYFCSREHANVCGAKAHCGMCPLNQVCLFGSQVISRGEERQAFAQ